MSSKFRMLKPLSVSSASSRPKQVGMKVDLLNATIPKKVVAEGIIVSRDPEKKLGSSPIEEGFWVVKINKAILPYENLLIARGNMRKVGHAIKQNMAWRKLYIKLKWMERKSAFLWYMQYIDASE